VFPLRLRVLEAAVTLTAVQLLVRIVPFSLLSRLLERVAARCLRKCLRRGRSSDRPATAPDPRVPSISRAIAAAACRLPWPSTCLTQAIAGRLMLAWRGVPAALVIGVRKDAGVFAAHAWLLCADGIVCGGTEAPEYHPIAAFTTRG
jgi:hypothetical protein